MKFEEKKVLVVGDVMLDTYYRCHSIGIAQEHPSFKTGNPVVMNQLGAAANVAANLMCLGASVSLCGTVGNDEAGLKIKALLRAEGIKDYTVTAPTNHTTVKSRWMHKDVQLFRSDHDQSMLDMDEIESVEHTVMETLGEYDAVIVSDYGKGTICRKVLSALRGAPFLAIDPYPQNTMLYPHADIMTPNYPEWIEMQHYGAPKCSHLVVTKGSKGASHENNIFHTKTDYPAICSHPLCVVGAGDVFIATATIGFLCHMKDPWRFANYCAGKAVSRMGTSIIWPSDVSEYEPEASQHSDQEDSTIEV